MWELQNLKTFTLLSKDKEESVSHGGYNTLPCGKLCDFNRIPFGLTILAFPISTKNERDCQRGKTHSLISTTLPQEDEARRNTTSHIYFLMLLSAITYLSMRTKQYPLCILWCYYHLRVHGGKTYYSIKPDPERLRPLPEFAPLTNARALKRVLGLCAYFAKCIPIFPIK